MEHFFFAYSSIPLIVFDCWVILYFTVLNWVPINGQVESGRTCNIFSCKIQIMIFFIHNKNNKIRIVFISISIEWKINNDYILSKKLSLSRLLTTIDQQQPGVGLNIATPSKLLSTVILVVFLNEKTVIVSLQNIVLKLIQNHHSTVFPVLENSLKS